MKPSLLIGLALVALLPAARLTAAEPDSGPWLLDLPVALEQARTLKKPVFLVFR